MNLDISTSMKNILVALFLSISFLHAQVSTPKYTVSEVPKKMSVKTKKQRFYYLLVPPIEKVYKELDLQYKQVKQELQDNNASIRSEKIIRLKKEYKVSSDDDLLKALKPHPRSIALAQAAMESAWGTSRFIREANNVFGMWSSNVKDNRIAADEKRGGTRTIWLRKFDSIEDSVRAYYKTLARGKTYKEFRDVKMATDDVYLMVSKLDKYSERGEEYTKELASMIRYNKLTKYDQKEENE